MDKPTEHQPLDNLFRHKLNDASVPVSTDVWNKLQDRLAGQAAITEPKPNRRIGAAWYWSVSAAASCLLLAFFWTSQNRQPTPKAGKPDLATTTKTAKQLRQQVPKIETPALAKNRPDKLIEPSIDNAEPIGSPRNQESVKTPDRLYANGSKAVESTQKTKAEQPELIVKTPDKQPDKAPVQVVMAPEKTTALNNGDPAAKPTPQNPERTLIVSVAEPVSKPAITETITPQPENSVVPKETPVKNARIARVFRQIKRLKEGETLARADINSNETDDEGGLFNRLVQSTRSKENQSKQQK